MLTSPVLDLQKQAGATLAESHGWHLPASYSSLGEEYEAITHAAGLLDRSYVGRLRLTGADALDLLDRLSTNKLQDLDLGEGMYTVLTSNKGRVMDLLFVLKLEDHLLVLTGPENRQKVADWIDFYTFTEDVVVEDVTEQTAMPALIGPEAGRLLDKVTGGRVSSLSLYGSLSASVKGVEMLVVRTDFAGLPAYDVAVPLADAGDIWARLLSDGAEFGVKPAGTEALEVVRVEQGVPEYGKELSEDVNPLEANLLGYISFDKGCYVGQEVVARLNTYRKVQRSLMGLSWDADAEPVADASLSLDREEGRSCHLGCQVAAAEQDHSARLREAGPRRIGGAIDDRVGRRRDRRSGRGAPLQALSHPPPSTRMTWPLIMRASSVQMKATTLAMSSGVTIRPAGVSAPAPQHLLTIWEMVQRSRLHVPSRHRVDRYALGGQLDGQVAGYGLQRGLRRPHREVVRQHLPGALAGNVDDAPAPGHQSGSLYCAQPRRPGVNVHGPVPVLLLQALGRGAARRRRRCSPGCPACRTRARPERRAL